MRLTVWFHLLPGLLTAAGCATQPTTPSPPTQPTTVVTGTLQPDGAGWQFRGADGLSRPATLTPELTSVIAEVAGDQTMGVNTTLEGQLTPEGLRATGWRCVALSDSCALPEAPTTWQLHGTEPFWSLQLSADRARMVFIDPRLEVALVQVGGDPAARQWRLEPEGGGATWSVTLEDTRCSDGMADTLWRTTAVVQTGDGQRLHGCAITGEAP